MRASSDQSESRISQVGPGIKRSVISLLGYRLMFAAIGGVSWATGKSGRGLPQSKTLRASGWFANGAERLGVLQPSGAFCAGAFPMAEASLI